MAVADATQKEEPALGYQEDDPVWGSLLRVKGLGDGLSKLAEVEPIAMRRGTRGVLHVEFWVDHVAFPAGESEWGTPGVNRLHVLNAGNVVIEVGNPSSIMQDLFADLQAKLDELAGRKALFDGKGEPTEPIEDNGEAGLGSIDPADGNVVDLGKPKRGRRGGAK